MLIARALLAAAAVAALVAWPSSATAYDTIVQDDAVLLGSSDQGLQRAVGELSRLGVDRVRLTIPWYSVAPSPRARRAPSHFNPWDPGAYPRGQYPGSFMALVDRAVSYASAAGLKVDLDIGFGAPRWAAEGYGRADHVGAVQRPDPLQFAAFSHAMVERYSGTYRAPNGAVLPAVDVFELWNEPNVPTFLQPQWEGDRAASADHYRALVAAAYPVIKRARPDATVLIGVIAPNGLAGGGATAPVSPMLFLRRLACLDGHLHRLHDSGCRHFRRVPGDGISIHPYALRSPPGRVPADSNQVRIGNLGHLSAVLGSVIARGRFARGISNLWITEFGYESNYPVATKPWTLDQQARLLAGAEYIARRNPHVRSIAQFLLRDVATAAALRAARAGSRDRAPGSWQTGLDFENGTPKPAAFSFRLTLAPLLGRRLSSSGRVALFGHVRPAKSPAVVRIEQQLPGRSWSAVGTAPSRGKPAESQFLTAADGTFQRVVRIGSARKRLYRLLWQGPDGSWEAGPAERPFDPTRDPPY